MCEDVCEDVWLVLLCQQTVWASIVCMNLKKKRHHYKRVHEKDISGGARQAK